MLVTYAPFSFCRVHASSPYHWLTSSLYTTVGLSRGIQASFSVCKLAQMLSSTWHNHGWLSFNSQMSRQYM